MTTKSLNSCDVVTGLDVPYRAQRVISDGLVNASGGAEYEDYTIKSLAQIIDWIVLNDRIVIPSFSNSALSLPSNIIDSYGDILTTLYIPDISPDKTKTFQKDITISITDNSPVIDLCDGRGPIHQDLLFTTNLHNLAVRAYMLPSDRNRYISAVNGTLKKVEDIINEDIEKTNPYLNSYFELDVPLIFNHVIEKAKNRADILSVAMELRHSKEATAFRQQLKLLDAAAAVDDRKIVIRILSEIDDKIKSLNQKISQSSSGLSIAIPYQIGINVDTIKEVLNKTVFRHRKRHLLFIEQLYESGKQARSVRRHLGKLL